MPATDRIRLTDLRFDAIVGILASEQVRAQPLVLQIELALDLTDAGAGDLARSVDYAAVAHQARFIAQHGRWRLIESLGLALCRWLVAPPTEAEGRAAVERARVHIAKPTILDGLAVPSVELERGPAPLQGFRQAGVAIEILEETALSAAYRVRIPPGGRWEPEPCVALLGVAGEALAPGQERARLSAPLENPGTHEACVLAVGAPLR